MEPHGRLSVERRFERAEQKDGAQVATADDLASIEPRNCSKQATVKLQVVGENLAGTHRRFVVSVVARQHLTDTLQHVAKTNVTAGDDIVCFEQPLELCFTENVRSGAAHRWQLHVYDLPADCQLIEDKHRIGSCALEESALQSEATLSLELHHRNESKHTALVERRSKLSMKIISREAVMPPSCVWPPLVVAHFQVAMQEGVSATVHSAVDKAHLVTLFYRARQTLDECGNPDVGTLYYVPAGRALTEDSKWSLPLARIADVYRGRHSDLLPVDLPESRCCSLVLDNGRRVDLSCADQHTRDLIVGAVVNTLRAALRLRRRLPL